MSKQHLLVSDVDDTLLGDDQALRTLVDWYESKGSQLRLVYASGRFVDSICESIDSTDLPIPDAIIGGVGTEIRRYPSKEPIGDWQERMSAHWNVDTVRAVLAEESDLERQPEPFQSEFKQSYFLYNAAPARLEQLKQKLLDAGIETNVIYSSQRDLDFLPAGVNKGTAAAFLAEYWDLEFDHVMVSGNSANDSDLFQQGFLGIVVGNAHDELKELDGPRIYQAEQGFAAGVLEGIRHWGKLRESKDA